MAVYSYSPSKTVFISEMKYTASQFTLIHCLEPESYNATLPPCAIIILGSLNNNNGDGYAYFISNVDNFFFGVEF